MWSLIQAEEFTRELWEIQGKVLSMRPDKLQNVALQNFRDLAAEFDLTLPERFLYEK